MIVISSCKKEATCDNCVSSSQPPIAKAGQDITATLPVGSITLDGTTSTDRDGTLTEYLWKKISGPAISSFTTASSAVVAVSNLRSGTYLYELTVTDNSGLSAKDTVKVTINSKEFLFNDLLWEIREMWDMGSEIYVRMPEVHNIHTVVDMEVFVEVDAPDKWIKVQPLLPNYNYNNLGPFYYKVEPSRLIIVATIFAGNVLIGRKTSIRVKVF